MNIEKIHVLMLVNKKTIVQCLFMLLFLLRSRDLGGMTLSFHKIYGLDVHKKTQGCCFQIYPPWDPVSKNLPKCRLRLDETALRYNIFTYTAKRVSVWTGTQLEISGLVFPNPVPGGTPKLQMFHSSAF